MNSEGIAVEKEEIEAVPSPKTDDKLDRPHTLSSLAKRYGRDKRTVQMWYSKAVNRLNQADEIGLIVGNTRCFSDEEAELLTQFAGDKPTPKVDLSLVKDVEIEEGNHQRILDNPSPAEGTLDLAQFRSSSVTKKFENPTQIASQFSVLADFLIDGLEADIERRQSALDEANSALQEIQEKAAEVKLETRLYKLQTDQISRNQNNATSEIEDALKALTGLVKKPEDSQ